MAAPKTLTEKPDAILLTFPQNLLKEYPGGEKQIRHILELMNKSDELTWCNTISAIPKHEVLHCYIVFSGLVQYRCNIVQYERNVSKEFNDGGIIRVFENKNWVTLCGPVVKAPVEIPRKGFQGFRYTSELF